MIVGLALDSQGWPLCCEMWPGNTTDVKTLLPVVQRLQSRFRVHRISIVTDRGMISQATVAALEAQQIDCDYILGVRMRRSKAADGVVRHRGGLKRSTRSVKDVIKEGRRYVVCVNEEQRRKEAADREAIVAHLRESLQAGDKSLVGNKGYRKFLKTTKSARFRDR